MKNWVKVVISAAMMLGIGRCCRHYNVLNINNLKAFKNDNTSVLAEKSMPSTSLDTSGMNEFKLDTLPQKDGFIELNWQMLAKTTFKPLSVDSLDGLIVLLPKFTPMMRALEGKNVTMKGYVIPIEETGDLQTLVLSANPYSMCFFCGNAGPESVMDIQLRNTKSVKRFKKDEKITFRGRLKLNDNNFNYFNFILEGGEWVRETPQ